jgi:hypothetical protein
MLRTTLKPRIGIGLGIGLVLATLATSVQANTAHAGDDAVRNNQDSTSVSALAGQCGSSYNHVGQYNFTNSGAVIGAVDVYYSSTEKRNCAVTSHKGDFYGVAARTRVKIRPSGWSWPGCNSTGCDDGVYSYYAGPVYTPKGVNMSNRCIDFEGRIYSAGGLLGGGIGRSNRHCG